MKTEKQSIELPETYDMKTTDEIKIGMTFCFTGPVTSWGPPLGMLSKVTDQGRVIGMAIAIIEDGQNWKPLKNQPKD